jgi:hypothetical protein
MTSAVLDGVCNGFVRAWYLAPVETKQLKPTPIHVCGSMTVLLSPASHFSSNVKRHTSIFFFSHFNRSRC